MAKKIALDFGHGGTDSGACGNGLREKDITLEIGQKVASRLKAHGFEVVTLRDNDSYVGDAGERGAKLGNTKADYALSIHVNSGGGTGAEIITPCKERYAYVEYYMEKELSKINKYRKTYSRNYNTGETTNRPIGTNKMYTNTVNATDYYGICREAWKKGVSADIVELFFIDNANDVKIFNANKGAYVEAIVKSICMGFDYEYKAPVVEQPKPTTPTPDASNGDTYYRVCVGSYKDKANAEAKQAELKQAGFDSFLVAFTK